MRRFTAFVTGSALVAGLSACAGALDWAPQGHGVVGFHDAEEQCHARADKVSGNHESVVTYDACMSEKGWRHP